jgi:hypothetical protein
MTEAFLNGTVGQGEDEILSPGLGAASGGEPAFELKFHLSLTQALDVEEWARGCLQPDSHGDEGSYGITSVYCDTQHLDVFHRSPGYRRSKYRLRRYGETSEVYLERKKRWGDRVKKTRSRIQNDDLTLIADGSAPEDWPGNWFLERVASRGLAPACSVTYRRTAFLGMAGESPVRLTLDRDLLGAPANGWAARQCSGLPLFPGGALLEMKFHVHLPELFRTLLLRLPLMQGRVSKYRRCVEVCGLASGPTPSNGRAGNH